MNVRPDSEDSASQVINIQLRKRPSVSGARHVYANEVWVHPQEHDFHLYFGHLVPPIVLSREDLDKLGDEIEVPIEVVAVIPASLVPGLIRALQEQWEAHQQRGAKGETS